MADEPTRPLSPPPSHWTVVPAAGKVALNGPPLVRRLDASVARRIVAIALLMGLLGQWLLVGQAAGINVLLWTAAILLSALLVRPRDATFDRLDAWLPPAALVFAALVAVRADETLLVFDTLTALTLTAASIAALGGVAVTRRSLGGLLRTAVHGTSFALGGSTQLRPALEGVSELPHASAAGRVRPIVTGLLLAGPVVAVFVALFAVADGVFASMLSRALDWRLDLADWPLRLMVWGLLAWVVAGVLVLLAGATKEVARDRPISLTRRLGTTEALTLLLATDLVFGVFVAIQAAYLFGGIDTLAASGMTYSEYARQGFFELVAVAVLAGGLVLALESIVRDRTHWYRIAAMGLLILTAPILASAAYRLALYQHAYGWTELRFYVAAAILWLGACVAAGLVAVWRDQSRWLANAAAILGLVVALGVNIVGPQAFVAWENVARALDPSRVPADGLSGLDATYLIGLGDDAIPVLVAAYPRLSPDDREIVGEALLERRAESLRMDAASGWPSWNLGRERALEVLRNASPP